MNWKSLLTTISLSSLVLCACGTDDDTAMNNTREMNQDSANLRTVSDNQNNQNQNRRITTSNVNNNQNRDITARNIANNTADNDQNGHTMNNGQNRMEVADRAAEKIAQMREVDRANVIVTNDNAYVAAKLTDNANNGLTSDVEKKISDMVKAAYPEIKHVYVSVNPDFYKRTTSYAEDIRNGRPVAGFFDEFSQLVRRVFPTER